MVQGSKEVEVPETIRVCFLLASDLICTFCDCAELSIGRQKMSKLKIPEPSGILYARLFSAAKSTRLFVEAFFSKQNFSARNSRGYWGG